MLNIPTLHDIEQMALSNPVLFACLQVKTHEDLTIVQFYRLTIKVLVENMEQMDREQLHRKQHENSVFFFPTLPILPPRGSHETDPFAAQDDEGMNT